MNIALTVAGSDSSGGGNVTLHPMRLTRDVVIVKDVNSFVKVILT